MIVGRMAREILARSHEKGGLFKSDSLGTKGQRFWGDAVSKNLRREETAEAIPLLKVMR
jgi:hypothetical protein